MIDLAVLKGSSFVVLGLARSGLTTARALPPPPDAVRAGGSGFPG